MTALIQVNVTNVTCAVSGYQPTFDLTWVSDNTQTGALYQIQLYTGTAQSPMQTAVGTPTTATANLSGSWVYAKQVSGGSGLAQYTPYWLTVQAVDSNGAILGAPSDPIVAVFIAVPLVSVTSDDRDVTLQWSRSATQELINQVNGFMVQINDANDALWQTATLSYPGNYTTASGNPAQTATFLLDFPVELAAQPLSLAFFGYAQTAQVGQVSNVQAFSQGPVTNQNFYTVAPQIQSAVNVAATPTQYAITVANQFGSATSAPTLVPKVYAGANLVTGATLSTPAVTAQTVTATLTLPSPPAAVANGAPLSLSLYQTDSGGTPIASGPSGAPHPLLTGIPTVAAGDFTAPATAGGAGALALVIAHPPGAPELGAALLTIVDSTNQTAFGPATIVGQMVQVQPTLNANATYNIQLQGLMGTDVGPVSTRLPFPTSPSTLVSASYDGTVAQASWTAPTGATPAGYRLRAAGGKNATPSIEVSALNGAIITAVPAAGLALEVAAFCSPGIYGSVISVPLLVDTPSVSQVTTGVTSGLVTVNWASVAGATAYLLQLYINGTLSGAPIPASSTSHSFTTIMPDDADYAVAIAAVNAATISGQTSAVNVTGPYGPLRSLPTALPGITDSYFDGINANVAWDAVEGATGYLVSVVIKDSQAAAIATSTVAGNVTSTSFPVTLTDTSQVYQTVAQAQFGPDLGAPSAQADLFKPGYYLAPSSASGSTAIYPATVLALPMSASLADVAASSDTMTCYLPPLAATGTTIGTVTGAGPFSLTPYTGAGSAQFPFALSIAGGASSEAWTFDGTPMRAQLQADYIQFLKNAEAAQISAYGILTIQQAIARLLPQTFSETLYYTYGFSTNPTTGGSIDLRPGMVLRVSAAPYQYINDAGSGSADNAFIGGPTLDFEISSYLSSGKWKLGFDAFFAPLVASQAISVTQPKLDTQSFSEQSIADAADLFFPLFNQPFYRLFIPSALQTPWSTGSDLPASNFAIAAATSFTNLTSANNLTGNTATLAYFGGRSVIRACIRITVDSTEMVVPIGTTVGNVLDRLGRRPPATSVAIQSVALQRPMSPVVWNPQLSYSVAESFKIRFDWNTMSVYGFANDSLNLPVLHGDILTTTVA